MDQSPEGLELLELTKIIQCWKVIALLETEAPATFEEALAAIANDDSEESEKFVSETTDNVSSDNKSRQIYLKN